MTTNNQNPISWKNAFLALASDPNYSGVNISSIKAASLSFSTHETLRFLETIPNLVLLTDDDGNSLLAFHHFKTMPSDQNPQDQKLVAIAGFDHKATPVIVNVSSIKNYFQVVPKWDYLKLATSSLDLKNLELETTTLRNAIIIPIQLLRIFLSSPDQSPASLAIQILLEMKRLDLHHTANPVTSSPASEPLRVHSPMVTASFFQSDQTGPLLVSP
jgi:hypothetical protein